MTLPATRLTAAAVLVAAAVVAIAVGAPTAAATRAVDHRAFSPKALVRPPESVECTLENGASARCLRIVVKYLPDDLRIGPFCPSTVEEAGGLWHWDGPRAGLYRVDGTFLRMLQSLGYSFFDPDGRVHVVDPAAGRPGVEHACLEAALDETVTMTVLLPETPVMAPSATRLGTVNKVGLALDGVPIFSDAPSVLHTGHLPALDTCGGHVDPGGWYHWHAVATDVEAVLDAQQVDATCAQPQASDAMFGYAFDGVPIYGSVHTNGTRPTDLDECRGHVAPTRDDPTGSYHYHASTSFPNLPPCLSGVQARNNFVTTAKTGIGSSEAAGRPPGPPPGGGRRPGQGPPGGGPPPGFTDAARVLGVPVQALMRAVQDNGGRRLDFAGAARALGVSESALRAALPPPPGP